MKRCLANNDSAMNEQNQSASCSKSKSTLINNCRKFSEEYKVFDFTSININNQHQIYTANSPQYVLYYVIKYYNDCH